MERERERDEDSFLSLFIGVVSFNLIVSRENTIYIFIQKNICDMRYIFNCCSAHFFFFKDFFDQQIFAIRIKLIIIPECRVERVHACMHCLIIYIFSGRRRTSFRFPHQLCTSHAQL